MIALIDCGSSKTPLIFDVVDEFAESEVIPMFDLPSTDLSVYKGFIISGAPILVTEVDAEEYTVLFEWVKTIDVPVLGICFGHQMIGMVHGASAHRQKEDRDWQNISVIQPSPLFDRLPEEVEMMEDHCECISIPPGFIHVGVSDSCINEAMQHASRPVFGVQFHPEVSGNHGAVLLENFVNICLKDSSETGQ